jgi:hypothetical protein
MLFLVYLYFREKWHFDAVVITHLRSFSRQEKDRLSLGAPKSLATAARPTLEFQALSQKRANDIYP